MPAPKNPLSTLAPVGELLDKALTVEGGVFVTLPSQAAAESLRFKCYWYRRADRKTSAEMYGNQNAPSVYDELVFRIHPKDDGTFQLAITKGEDLHDLPITDRFGNPI